jgi:hypothetical protein
MTSISPYRRSLVIAALSLGVALHGCAEGDSSEPGKPLPPSSLQIATTFATYLPAEIGMIRDVAVDVNGDVYIAGGTPDLTALGGGTTFVPTIGPAHGGGDSDTLIIKLDQQGRIIWSRLMGGPNHDRAYAIELDDSGLV